MSKAKTVLPLKKRAEFLAVAASGKKWVAPAFIMQVKPNPPAEGAGEDAVVCRVGLTASKKMIGIAVKRNRARRRLRALAQEMLGTHALPGHDFVFIARTPILTCPAAALRQDLEKALKRFKLWREDS